MSIFLNHCRQFSKVAATPVFSGLEIHSDFFGQEQSSSVADLALDFFSKLQQATATPVRGRTYLSQQHNLNSKEEYQSITLKDSQASVKGELFSTYGGSGHQLAYFRGNHNIPQWVWGSVVKAVKELDAVKKLGPEHSWNFTWNTYSRVQGEEEGTGFAWHKDIPSNGDITVIYTLGQTALFSLRHPAEKLVEYTYRLPSDSLLILSDDVRWDWEHKVEVLGAESVERLLPQDDATLGKLNRVGLDRISLVLGAMPQQFPTPSGRLSSSVPLC